YGVDLTLQGQPSPFWHPAPGNGAPMPSTLKAILVHTAKDLAFRPHLTDSANPDTGSVTVYHKGPDLTTGYGALDVAEAQRLVQSGTIFEEELATIASHQYTVPVAGDSTLIPQPLKVTLAWSDPPGSTTTASVAPKLVNDLDLVVIAPNGQRFYPWTVPQPYVPASPAAYPENVEPEPLTAASIGPAVQNQEDHLNNLEQVYVETPMAGTWTVRIQPAGLAAPPQRYSLVLGTPEKPAQHLSGGKVAWVSTNRASTAQIFVKDSVPNGTVRQLTWGSNPSSQPVWAPNGAYLSFITQETLGGVNGGTLVIADMAGNSVARWFRPFNTQYIGNPSFSWDARHIAVSYYDNWGCLGLAVVDFADPYAFHTATMRTLVPALCDAGHPDPFEPDFSHDGEYVYFNGTDDYPAGPGGIFRIPTAGGPIERVFGDGVPVRRAFALSVSPDGKRIVYNSELWREDPVRNWDEESLTVDLETGVTTQLTFEPGHQYGAYAVGGDGEMVMDSSSTASGNRDLFLMENGHRVRLDISDPSNSYNDIYSVWWKRAPRCIATPAGLRAWYAMDALQGTQFADLAGGINGTVGNGATSALGMVNSGLGFDGVDDFASVPNQSQLNVGTGDFAITAWVRLPAGDTGTRVLLDKRQSSPLRGYQLLSNRGCLMLQLADAVGSGYSNYSSNVCIADGKWHHVAVSIRRNSATGIQWYRDGAASTVSNSVARNGSLDSTGPLYIGRAINGGVTWRGQLDELLLFGRALAASEVQALFQAGPSGMCR
ncbi:MAG TPA: LamG-like jellyroll fold domain-containing protein, partial [Archangium sp.]|nr:LamG-like jellyroll fold domain-containing protein [Archangium sp.]